MKIRLTLFLSLLICCMAAVAKSLSVTSFKPLPNDLTANIAGTMVKDQNGEVAALIKVVTTQTGFTFEGGMAGIVKTRQEAGEIWVYVPHGIQKITMKHPQLGVLRDYYFPCAIEEARTYELVLASGEVPDNNKKQLGWVVLDSEPSGADVYIGVGDELPQYVGTTPFQKKYEYGRYTYSIRKNMYHDCVRIRNKPSWLGQKNSRGQSRDFL